MRTRREIGRMLFSHGEPVYTANRGGGASSITSMARGTLTKDTWEDEDHGTRADILVDGSDSSAEYGVDNSMSEGQRVRILYYGAHATVLPDGAVIESNANSYTDIQIVQTENRLNNSITQAAKDAAGRADELAQQIDDVDVKVSGFDGRLDSISTQVSGAVETANEALTSASSAQQDVNGFRTEVSQTYQTKQEASDAMAQEVLDRNSAIEQSASSIRSEVSQTYQTKDGMSEYATQSELTQTSTDLTATFTQQLSAKGSVKMSQPSPPYNVGDVWIDAEDGIAYTCTRERSSGSYSSSDWSASPAFISAYVRQDVNGVTVGKSGSGWKARVSTSGTFDILNGSDDAVVQVGTFGTIGYLVSSLASLQIRSTNNGSNVTLDDSNVHLSSEYGTLMTPSVADIYPPNVSYDLRIMGCVLLYANDSGTTGTVRLNRSASYYQIIDIYYGDQNGRLLKQSVCGEMSSSRISDISNGSTTNLFQYVANSSQGYLKSVMLTISGLQITQSNSYGTNLTSSGNSMVSGDLRIYAVLGWSV